MCPLLRFLLVLAVTAVGARAYIPSTDASGVYVVKWYTNPIPLKIMLSNQLGLSDGGSLAGAVVSAAEIWNAQLGTNRLAPQIVSPSSTASKNDTNEVVMNPSVGGYNFPSGVLAVTLVYGRANEFTETDVIFNSAYSWDSYRGLVRSVDDVRRVAIHELGHVLGLEHPDAQNVVAIMNSRESAIDTVQTDDINGIHQLYGAPGVSTPNDTFATATPITLADGSLKLTAHNLTGTREPGEGDHAGSSGRHSVWWRWQAPTTGRMVVDTLGSDFDTVLAVYTGGTVGTLTEIAANDDEETPDQNATPQRKRTSKVAFDVVGGATYSIAVDGWGSASTLATGYNGSITLNLAFTSTLAPEFTQQPSALTVQAGAAASFTATATGKPTPTYRWQRQRDGTGWFDIAERAPYSGTLTTHLTVSTAIEMDGEEFRCVASNLGGATPSAAVTLRVTPVPPPLITRQPSDTKVFTGSDVWFEVTASGADGYQWYRDGTLLSGQNRSWLMLPQVASGDEATYSVVVINSGGSVTSQSATLSVLPLLAVTAVRSAAYTTMFIRADGSRWIMGVSQWPPLGLYKNIYTPQPLRTAGNDFPVLDASVGFSHNLYVAPDHTLWAHGDNAYGQLGDGTTTARWDPVPVAQNVARVLAGTYVSLFLKTDGTLWGMGSNQDGMLGDAVRTHLSPVQIDSNVVDLCADDGVVLLRKTDGSLWGLGSNSNGQLGNGTTQTSSVNPLHIADDVVACATGRTTSYYIRSDGSLWGLGGNQSGQLGDRPQVDYPTAVYLTDNAAQIAAAYGRVRILKRDGSLWSLGDTRGEFGYENSTTSLLSVLSSVATDVIAVACSTDRTFFIKSDGSLWGTGYSYEGELGLGWTDPAPIPKLITGGPRHATATVTWSAPGPLVAGNPLTADLFHATADVLGTFTTDPAAGTLLAAGEHQVTVTFTPALSAYYEPVTATFPVTVLPSYAGTYFGTIEGGGEWALLVHADNSGTFLARLAPAGRVIVTPMAIATDGSFSAEGTAVSFASSSSVTGTHTAEAAAASFALSGKIQDASVAGSLDGGERSFEGAAAGSTGGAPAGFYTAPVLGEPSAAGYTIIAPDGQFLCLVARAVGAAAASGVVGTDGHVTSSTSDGGNLTITVGGDSQWSLAFTPAGAAAPLAFSGLAEGVAGTTQLANLSVRSAAGRDSRTLIVGFVVTGTTKPLLVRGIGPTLTQFGVTSALADPQLRLFNKDGIGLDQNEDWGGSSGLAALFSSLGAFPLPLGSRDAALQKSVDAGVYTAHVTTTTDSTGVALVELYDAGAFSPGTTVTNMSARTQVGQGDEILIAGFVVRGNAPQTLLVRGVGPSLARFGVTDALADPTLRIYRMENGTSTLLAENNDWSGSAALDAAFAKVGAFAFDSLTSSDAALLITVQPGVYTAQVSGVGALTGVALVEIYAVP